MCTAVLRFISESVTKNILEATSGILTLWSPSHLSPSTSISLKTTCQQVWKVTSARLFVMLLVQTTMEGFQTNSQRPQQEKSLMRSTLSYQWQCKPLWMEDPQASLLPAAGCQRTEQKRLWTRAITTMKSFLAGRGTAVKSRIQTDKVLEDYNSKEETLAGGYEGKRKKSQWKRCFSGWQRKNIQPAPLKPLDEPVRSASTELTSWDTGDSKQGSCCSQETPSTTPASASVGADLRSTQLALLDYVEDETSQDTRNRQSSADQSQPVSNNHADVEETTAKKSNCFSHFFRNIFSKVRIPISETT